MIGESFNQGWTFRRRVAPFQEMGASAPEPVTLPHDAMLTAGRDPDGDAAVAYYRGGAYEYEKRFMVPDEWRGKTVRLRFEGVYRDAAVFVNGAFATHRPYGYSEFHLRLDDVLDHGEENVVRVECRNGDDSRWYSGAGIYRDVTLFVADQVHVALDGLRVTTPQIEDDLAVVDVAVEIENDTTSRVTVDVRTEIIDSSGNVVAVDVQPLTVEARACAGARPRLQVANPARWSVEEPSLYECSVRILRGDDELDVSSTVFGIRSLTVDARHGLRINGEVVKLRGACVHHDNGILGAATIGRADERRVALLKAAGFNAIRSSHQPIGRAMLDACDRLGMLVMDEAFDAWREAKREHDYALHFPTWWERDVDAMVAKDVNHPSVIMYSIGNEIRELGTPAGAMQSRAMAERIRRLDPTRPVTNGVNFMLTVLSEVLESGVQLNAVLGGAGEAEIVGSDRVTQRTAESLAALDVAGYNYADSRYESDRARFPNRVIVGSETFPRLIDRNWRLVLDNDHVIGDFTWTGWDYLGEVGIGRIEFDSDPSHDVGGGFTAGYPWRYAACGDIDITGYRLPISYYREIVFGLRTDPYIAVRPPSHHGAQRRFSTPWSWSSAVESWTWDGDEDRMVTIEVYADADEVDLLQDGRSLGRQPAGERHRFSARFETTYEPGELTAVAYRSGAEVGRTTLRSALGDVVLRVEVDRTDISTEDQELAFVTVSLVDGSGTLHTSADIEIAVEVDGPAVLQGLGSAAPSSEESFLDSRCTTYRGRALAAVRPTGPGDITVIVSAAGCAPASVGFVAM